MEDVYVQAARLICEQLNVSEQLAIIEILKQFFPAETPDGQPLKEYPPAEEWIDDVHLL